MKAPLKWIQDYAKFTCTPQEFSDKMTMTGTKVETFECEADHIKNVVIGRVEKIEPHPNADKLVVCTVNVGAEAPLTICTGAHNLHEGDVVPVALHGSTLPGGVEIRRGKLRGVESNGMLCSLSELGLTSHDFPGAIEDGIMVLDEADTPYTLGENAVKALGMDDIAYDFEITPNRPDCLAVRGVAREAAATFDVPFKAHEPKMPTKTTGDINDYLRVKIEAPEICQRYTAAVVTNVRVKPSPRWMRERLRLCGVRPINNIVDITNYVMLEYGHPMHAFDYKYVNGKIITPRLAKEGEEIETLDGVCRKLSSNMLVIADEKGPIAVAGVMGGEYSGVYEDTTTIVFEGACFEGPSVRVTARRLGMRTEASGRFEKGLNPDNCKPAVLRALELIEELDAGDIVGGLLDEYPHPRAERRIPLEVEKVNRRLGTDLSREEMVKIMLSLGFGMEGDTILVPTDRYDMEGTHDVSEEVARIYGYNNIPSTIMTGTATARPTPRQTFDKMLIERLVGYGLYECETFSFYSPKCYDLIRLPADSALRRSVVISNPLGEDTSIMRTTAIPSMLEVVARNYNARAESAALFENATEYIPDEDPEKLPSENGKLIIALYGPDYSYYTVKGIVEGLLKSAKISNYRVVPNTSGTVFHPGRAADLYVGDVQIAKIGEVHPMVAKNYGIKPRVYLADVDVTALFDNRGGTVEFAPLPRHPAITRDLALVADLNVLSADIVAAIEKGAGANLEELRLFDVYTGEKVGDGKKSLAYSLRLRHGDRTLTDEEADSTVAKVLEEVGKLGVVLRA